VPSGHLLHADCGQRLHYAKHCPVHGAVDSAAIVRGYEYGPDRHVVVGPEELDQLHPSQDRALRLERFLAPAQLDPVLYSGRSLYLVPDGPAAEPGYAVLHAALVQQQRWALPLHQGGNRQIVLAWIAHKGHLGLDVVVSDHQHLQGVVQNPLCAQSRLVRPSGAALALQVLHYPEQVRSYPLTAVRLAEKAGEELRLAGLLIDAAAGTIGWSASRDQAAQELKALIEAKLAGRPVAKLESERAILPLLEALQQSVAAQNGHATAPSTKTKTPRKRTRRTA
jgi:non-homologous end joining protein Ku